VAVGGGVDGIDAEAFARDLERATRKGVRLALKDLAAEQRQLISEKKRPAGGAQKQNTPGTKRRKKGKPPLWNQGILRDDKQWRIRKRGDEMVLRPPASRETAVAILRHEGFRTVFDELPEDFEGETLQGHLDEQSAKVEAKAKRRSKK
jgi:hypothetical protein